MEFINSFISGLLSNISYIILGFVIGLSFIGIMHIISDYMSSNYKKYFKNKKHGN